jgi:hypothetical protein
MAQLIDSCMHFTRFVIEHLRFDALSMHCRCMHAFIESCADDCSVHNTGTESTVSCHIYPRLSLAPLKEVQRNDPFLALVVSPQLGARQKEQPPVDVPLSFLSSPVGLAQNRFQFSGPPALVQVRKPPVGSLFVVLSVDPPVALNRKLFGKINKQVVTGHGPAREEILGHPSLFELVAEILVGENVDK